MKNSDENLNNIRHSAAHLLAAAVMQLYPNAKRTIGPAIENGFYYDFEFENPISEENFPKIEAKMAELLPAWTGFEKREVSADEAKKMFVDNAYKLELISEIEKNGEKITIYKSGDFEDLCKGGHSENPKEDIGAFKLLSLAGAYWRGSEKNKMLTRIYGTAFPTQKEADDYIMALEEAKKHDHRKLGQELGLFTISEEVGSGLILWLPKGTIIKDELENFGKETEKKWGYQRVSTPLISKEGLFYQSGHLPYYKDDMFPPMQVEGTNYYLKPMNCPHMHMIYKAQKHSYRELPIRYAEYGLVHRYEESGTLMGLMRVRGITQNDAHIYCSEEQVYEEVLKVMSLHKYYYDLFGIKDYYIELALPDFETKKDKYFDNPQGWEKSIAILRRAVKESGIEVVEKKGTAAFYAPKFDFNIKSVTGREFGASTNQLDFGSGKNFNLTYTDKDGSEKIIPYILHRAPLGSSERFIGFLIEHYGGAFPLWLAPNQVTIVPIADRHLGWAQKVFEQLSAAQVRVEIDSRAEKMQGKIRDAQLQKVPYMLIVGDREEKEGTVALRTRDGQDLGTQPLEDFVSKVKLEIETKS